MALTTAQIQNAYVTFFNRPADVAGLNYWSNYTGSLNDLYTAFSTANEYLAAFAGMNNTQIVTTVYQNLFNRAPDVAGLNYWVLLLDQGKINIGNVAFQVNQGAQGTDKTIITNKVTAATNFTNQLDTSAEINGYANLGLAARDEVKAWLSGVDSTAGSVANATVAIPTVIEFVVDNQAGSTFTLTTSATDNVLGTPGVDLILGEVTDSNQPTAANTLHASDVIDGRGGNDTLRVTASGNSSEVVGFTMSNVENLEVRSYGDDVTLGLVNVTGLKNVISTNSTGDIYLNDVQNIVALDLTGNGSTGITVEVNYADDVAAGAQSLTLDRFQGQVGDANNDVIHTVNIVSQNRASDVSLAFYDANAYTVAGDADLTLYGGEGDLYVDSLDAHTFTGNLDAYIDNFSAATTTVIGGSGNDTIHGEDLGSHVLSFTGNAGNDKLILSTLEDGEGVALGDTIAGGTGTDTLVIVGEDSMGNIDAAGTFAHASSLEVVTFTDEQGSFGSQTFDGELTGANAAGVRTYNFTESGSYSDITLANMADAVTLNFDLSGEGEGDDDLTYSIASSAETTSNTLNINFTTDGEDGERGNFTINGVETLNLSANDLSTAAGATELYAANLDGNQLKTVNISGNDDVYLDAIGDNVGAAALTKIDAHTLTGDLTAYIYDQKAATAITVLGGSGNDYISQEVVGNALYADGGAGNDELDGYDANDTLIGGAGNDSLYGYEGDDSLDGGDGNDLIDATGSGIDTVVGGAGNDTILFTGGDGIDPLTSELTSADWIDGGTGTDEVRVEGAIMTNDAFFYHWKSVETLTLDGTFDNSLVLNAIANDAGLNTINSQGGADTIVVGEGFSRALEVVLTGGGDVSIDGSTSPFSLTVTGAAAQFTAADSLLGGTGTGDVLHVLADNDGTGAVFGATVSGFETISVTNGGSTTNDVKVTTSDAMLGAGKTLTVDASTLVSGNAFTFDGSLETNGKYAITSGAGADALTGGAGADTINGGAGNDTITGGLGKDALTGGTGADTFVFATALESNGVNTDTITDFVSGTDKIDLAVAVTYAGSVAGYGQVLTTLASGTTTAVIDASTNTLYVDLDASGTLDNADLSLVLTGVTTLASGDFV